MENRNTEPSLFITVAFKPAFLPTGTIDADDLAEFVSGIQGISDTFAEPEFGSKINNDSRLIIADVQSSSFLFILFYRDLIHIFNSNSEIYSAGSFLFNRSTIKSLLNSPLGEKGRHIINSTGANIDKVVSFLANAASDHPESLDADRRKRFRKPTKQVADICKKYPEGVQIGTNSNEHILTIDEHAARNMENFVIGGTYQGNERQFSGNMRSFFLDKLIFKLRPYNTPKKTMIECRFDRIIEDIALDFYRAKKDVTITGVPFYPVGINQTGLPSYIKVISIEEFKHGLWDFHNN